jgi:ATP-binding cassette subfamily B protein
MAIAGKKKAFNFSLFGRVYGFVRPYRSKFYSSLVLSFVLAIISPVRGILIQYTVDKGIKGNIKNVPAWLNRWFDEISNNDIVQFLIILSVVQIAMLVLETILRFIFTFTTAWLGQHVVKDLRVTVYKKVLGLHLRHFDNTPIGTLTTRTINDIESINDIFADGLIPIVADMLTILFTLFAMLYMDWQLTLICLIPFPILLFATWIFKDSVN